MPYARNSDLPEAVRNSLPDAAQTMWRTVFNSALQTYEGNETRAFQSAWAAVKKRYVKQGDQWVKRSEARKEAGMEIREGYEAIDLTGARVDVEKRIIHDVSIMGPKSAHGYGFSQNYLRQAPRRIEGSKILKNHLEGDRWRPVDDVLGRFKNVQFNESRQRITADAHVRVGPGGDQMLADAEHNPDLVGFSLHHKSRFDDKSGEGQELVECYSVDWVAEPATVSGMFEAQTHLEDETMDWDKVTIDDLKVNCGEMIESIVSEAVQAAKATETEKAELDTLRKENAKLKEAQAKEAKSRLIDSVLAEAKFADPETPKRIRPLLEKLTDKADMEAVIKEIRESKTTESEEARGPGGGENATADKDAALAAING